MKLNHHTPIKNNTLLQDKIDIFWRLGALIGVSIGAIYATFFQDRGKKVLRCRSITAIFQRRNWAKQKAEKSQTIFRLVYFYYDGLAARTAIEGNEFDGNDEVG